MRCPRCAAGLPPDATACGRCGAAQQAAPWARPWEVAARPRPRRTGVLAVVAVLVTAALTWGVTTGLAGDEPRHEPAARAHPATSSAARAPAAPSGFAQVYARTSDGVGEVVVRTCGDQGWSGTAFLVSETTAVTAHHVLADASEVRLELDGGTVEAQVSHVDVRNDLAVLELAQPVEGHVFELAARSPQPGSQVAAIGYPMGEPKTLTVGSVSGLDREVRTESGRYSGLLQTDTAINPGSSGGPVLDPTGRVVGVAGAVRADAQGIGFAIPSTTVRRMLRRDLPGQPMDDCS
jgi:serine protease Do